ncbi:hypothetical protein VF14_30270 [Nostoc linckia z18]|uniref:Uncharacterized protein n=2 Tax=Nostoc linckia TaxID=92942 RepID=A0A9Q5Z797_NOSLI|nr:hypothetical protein [Nostoc linckia]PHK30619.1 hypothetical protein VF12_29285 [Nostoc linckia z15]PHK43055.1 hypothetical protein VF13_28550 [Nostoc linckia z16]PHJ57294.1 hypothetical protein VF02_30630 [Nostoc linckia z1]PHJ57812.1 hypothetical protein VF05_35055 [Nostoc linckia z3]PHJ64265.1 hypothetical protein VF03_29325 [Nostoc linckia z2]
MKKFPNLFPKDLPRTIQRSRLVFKQGKWREVRSKGEERTASGIYNFVVTLEGIVFIHRVSTTVGDKRIGHIDLAMGRDVKYAGQIYFSGRNNRGILRKWTNESGHYQPSPEFMNNAGLPEAFFEAGSFKSLKS